VKYLGVDFGLRKLGIASGDDETGLAFPVGNVDGGEGAIDAVIEAAQAEAVDALVVGLPIPAVYSPTKQLELTKRFVRDLEAASGMKVFVVDEQFTSAMARSAQAEFGSNFPEDAIAATILLQAFLDGDRDLTLETAGQLEE
jgi:putative Holliday junction resolvase